MPPRLASGIRKTSKTKIFEWDYIIRGLNPQYGQDINIVIELLTPIGRRVEIISGWKVHPLGLITCNTPLAMIKGAKL